MQRWKKERKKLWSGRETLAWWQESERTRIAMEMSHLLWWVNLVIPIIEFTKTLNTKATSADQFCSLQKHITGVIVYKNIR